MKKCTILILTTILFSQIGISSETTNTTGKNLVFSITNFKNTVGAAELNWISEAIGDSITVDLAKLNVVRVVNRNDLKKILREQQLSNSALADADSAIKIGKLVSAKAIITGDFISTGNEIRINAKVLDSVRGEVVSAFSVSSDKTKLFNMCRQIIIQLLKGIRIDLDSDQLQQLGDSNVPSTNIQAIETNYNGVIQSDNGNKQEAIKLFKKAMELDRNYGHLKAISLLLL